MRTIHGVPAGLVLTLTLSGCGGLSGGAGDALAVGRVVCQNGTSVPTPLVRVQPDGVHLRVDNRTGAGRLVYRQEDETSARELHDAPPGISGTVSLEAPGEWRVVCTPPPLYPQEDSPWVELEVVDPDGLWVSDQPECDVVTSTHPDYFEDLPRGHTGDLLKAARREVPEWMEDPQPEDVVEAAGYPEGRIPQFRVVRDGRVVAVASYRDDGRGGWLFGSIDYCTDEDEGIPEPAD